MKTFRIVSVLAAFLGILTSCTKQVGKNPGLAYSDKALFDSCRLTSRFYYLNDSNTVYSGSSGPHGAYTLKFNRIAFKALSDKGKLPLNSQMPEGSLVVKLIQKGQTHEGYAFMYKKSGAWLWGELGYDGSVQYSVDKNPSICVSCHSQDANRDLILTFKYH